MRRTASLGRDAARPPNPDVPAHGVRPQLDLAHLARRRLVPDREIRLRLAADRLDVHPDARARSDTEPDVAGDGLEPDVTLGDRLEDRVAGDRLHACAVADLAGEDVARD